MLLGLVEGTTPVQAFAAGAALCSTSLGTTFTILSTSGLSASRLGVVLSSAAMLDDIVGLVMSGIISRLGDSSGSFQATTVIRPVFVSVAFAVILPLICMFVVKPLTRWCYGTLIKGSTSRARGLLTTEYAAVTLHTLVLAALIAGASYAGTSVLFAAYLAGAAISWWDTLCNDLRTEGSASKEERPNQREVASGSEQDVTESASDACSKQHQDARTPGESNAHEPNLTPHESSGVAASTPTGPSEVVKNYDHLQGTHIFKKYFGPALRTVLKPFFFASIGFAIPITRMFSGEVVWRGIVYTILMVFAKLACGLCLIRFTSPIIPTRALRKLVPARLSGHAVWPFRMGTQKSNGPAGAESQGAAAPTQTQQPKQKSKKPQIPKPMSLYPATMLGSAMVARGEIGFLISSVAESNGVFGPSTAGGSSELYLIVTWAILLCTLIGPVTVGLMAKRVKRLQAMERHDSAGRTDPLGIWGMQNVKPSRTERI